MYAEARTQRDTRLLPQLEPRRWRQIRSTPRTAHPIVCRPATHHRPAVRAPKSQRATVYALIDTGCDSAP
eukprot:scaffold7712_cov119-Isochrysis_galbana.AAC.20